MITCGQTSARVVVGAFFALLLAGQSTRERHSRREPETFHAQALDGAPCPPSFGCGPAALLAAARIIDQSAAENLYNVLQEDPRASRPVSTLKDLAGWAQAAGMSPVALRVSASSLDRIAVPFVAHMTPSHFTAVLARDRQHIDLVDRGGGCRRVSRDEFDRQFSGHMLIFNAAPVLARSVQKAGVSS